jgi:hypothetical protein
MSFHGFDTYTLSVRGLLAIFNEGDDPLRFYEDLHFNLLNYRETTNGSNSTNL